MIVVALFPVPVVALHTLLLAAAIYFPSDIFSFNLYSGIIDFIFMLPVSSDALLLSRNRISRLYGLVHMNCGPLHFQFSEDLGLMML